MPSLRRTRFQSGSKYIIPNPEEKQQETPYFFNWIQRKQRSILFKRSCSIHRIYPHLVFSWTWRGIWFASEGCWGNWICWSFSCQVIFVSILFGKKDSWINEVETCVEWRWSWLVSDGLSIFLWCWQSWKGKIVKR